VVVKTNFPLEDIIWNKDANGRIVKWVMELCPLLSRVPEPYDY
jgi:hypothetical protein